MASARIDLIAVGDDESRQRERRRGVKALAVLAGLVLLAFAERQPEPALRLDGGATDFGALQVGNRSTEPVTLRNATDEPFVVAGIAAEGAVTHQDFSVDMTRCGTIAPGTECVATVSFAPREAGPQSAKFRVIDASNEASQTIVVRGTGVIPAPPPPPEVQPVPTPDPEPPPAPEPPPIQPAPPVVRRVPPPQPAPAPVPVPVPKIETPAPKIEEPTPAPAPEPVPDIEVIEVPVEDTPEPTPEPAPQPQPKPEEKKKESRFKSFLKKAAPVAIPLIVGAVIANNQDKGNREPQTKRRLEVSPRSLEIPTTGRSYVSEVTVTNVGTEPVTIRSITLGGSQVFAQSSECEGLSLAPGKSCPIKVGLAHPGLEGAATLVIDSDAGRERVSVSAKASRGKE